MTTYEQARAALLEAELDLMLQRERVAQLRRALPPGPVVEDYELVGPAGPMRLSRLFTAPDRPLVLYHFMFGGRQRSPCPMCSLWADGWAPLARHLAERLDLALVTAAPIADTVALAAHNGWDELQWLSATGTTFKCDIGGEDGEGNQLPFLSVYTLTPEGPRLTYSGGAHLRDEHWRGVDLLSPVWHFLDLTPRGRGDWMPPGRSWQEPSDVAARDEPTKET